MTDAITCPKCSKIHEHCTAHNRAGAPCGREPSEYQTVCTMHGGASPRALRAAAERKAHAVVTAAYDADDAAILAAQGLEPIADPLTELGRLAAQATHFMDALGSRVNALDSIRFTDAKGTEQLASEIALYERAMDRTARLLKLLVDSGFEERRLRIDEQTATAFSTVLTAVLARLQLTHEQRALVATVVPEELRAVQGG